MTTGRRELLLLPWLGRSLRGGQAPRAAAGETHVFRRTAHCELKADVFRAPAEGPRPAIVWIHGGALIFGTRANLLSSRPAQLKRYLDAGFTVATIDYRLAPETCIDGILEDVREAIAWVRRDASKLGVDASRLALVGHSAGGYLALQMAWSVRPVPRAVASFYGYGEIAGDWYSKPDPFYSKQPKVSQAEAMAAVGKTEIAEPPPGDRRGIFYLYTRQAGLWPKLVTGKDPGLEPAAFADWCPVRHVSRRFPPTILLHGSEDTDVPHEKSVEMAAALRRRGVPHELALLPGLGHSFDRAMDDPTVLGAFNRALDFLLKHTRPLADGRGSVRAG